MSQPDLVLGVGQFQRKASKYLFPGSIHQPECCGKGITLRAAFISLGFILFAVIPASTAAKDHAEFFLGTKYLEDKASQEWKSLKLKDKTNKDKPRRPTPQWCILLPKANPDNGLVEPMDITIHNTPDHASQQYEVHLYILQLSSPIESEACLSYGTLSGLVRQQKPGGKADLVLHFHTIGRNGHRTHIPKTFFLENASILEVFLRKEGRLLTSTVNEIPIGIDNYKKPIAHGIRENKVTGYGIKELLEFPESHDVCYYLLYKCPILSTTRTNAKRENKSPKAIQSSLKFKKSPTSSSTKSTPRKPRKGQQTSTPSSSSSLVVYSEDSNDSTASSISTASSNSTASLATLQTLTVYSPSSPKPTIRDCPCFWCVAEADIDALMLSLGITFRIPLFIFHVTPHYSPHILEYMKRLNNGIECFLRRSLPEIRANFYAQQKQLQNQHQQSSTILQQRKISPKDFTTSSTSTTSASSAKRRLILSDVATAAEQMFTIPPPLQHTNEDARFDSNQFSSSTSSSTFAAEDSSSTHPVNYGCLYDGWDLSQGDLDTCGNFLLGPHSMPSSSMQMQMNGDEYSSSTTTTFSSSSSTSSFGISSSFSSTFSSSSSSYASVPQCDSVGYSSSVPTASTPSSSVDNWDVQFGDTDQFLNLTRDGEVTVTVTAVEKEEAEEEEVMEEVEEEVGQVVRPALPTPPPPIEYGARPQPFPQGGGVPPANIFNKAEDGVPYFRPQEQEQPHHHHHHHLELLEKELGPQQDLAAFDRSPPFCPYRYEEERGYVDYETYQDFAMRIPPKY